MCIRDSHSDREDRESGYRSNRSDSSEGNRPVTRTTETYHNGNGQGAQEPIAVSYTHLDVYKRQVMNSRSLDSFRLN